jgi:betaine lipid synthase
MIPNYLALSERIDQFLHPNGVRSTRIRRLSVICPQIIGVCDFYVSGRDASPLSQAVGAVGRQCGWLSRFFWLHWCVDFLW